MYEARFAEWVRWGERSNLPSLHLPGVCAFAYRGKSVAGEGFSWRSEIIYGGMTNAASGLKGRLKQFDNMIVGKRGHGGADRVRYRYPDYGELVKRLMRMA